MADFFAFAGLRYDCNAAGTELEALVAPPYDVIDEDLRAALEAPATHNSVRLILPRDETPEGDRYARAADTLAAWEREGVLAVDPAPRFYSYRMEFTDPHGDRAPHPRRHRRARAARGRTTRRAPARADAAEGEVRPARAAAGDAGQRRSDLGPDPRLGPHRAARARHGPRPLRRHRRRRATSSAPSTIPPRIAEIRGRRRRAPTRAGRRPSPLRDRAATTATSCAPRANRSAARARS